MELSVLKKKMTSYRSKEGKFVKVPGELLIAVLRAWEGYTGPMAAFGKEVGIRQSQLGPLIHRARLHVKSSVAVAEDFTEVSLPEVLGSSTAEHSIELSWEAGKVIRFKRTEDLVEFLKKVS